MKLTDKFFSLFQRDALLFFATLLTGIVIARKLGPEMMGIWTILLLIPGYAEAFGRLQFDVSAVYFIGKKQASVSEITLLLHVVALIASITVLTVFFIGFDWFYSQLFKNVDLDVKVFAYAILSIFPLRLIYINYSYLLIAQQDVLAYNSMVITQALVTSFISVCLILVFDMGIMGAMAGSVAGLIISIMYGAFKVQRIGRLKLKLNIKLLFDMAKYSVHHYISGLTGYFQNSATSLISAVYISPSQVAFYAVGKSICEVATRMVPVAVNTVLFPKVSREKNALDSIYLVARLFRITLLILLTSSCLLAIGIKPVVFILYGSEYYPLIAPFLIMISGVVLVQSATVFSSYFSGSGRPDLLAKISFFPLMLQIVLALFLVPEYGVNGAALSFFLSSLLLFILYVFCFIRLSGLNYLEVFIRLQDVITVWDFVKGKTLKVVTRLLYKV